jgi:glycosyltransferase involved in cell wall biosynthesis
MLRDVDIFAMPSTWEGFGVSAIEASAMRLPVVASNIHGIPDVVVDGETGILVPPADAEALAGAIERLVTTPGLPASMGDAGRAFVEKHYDWRDNTRLMERLYDDMVHRRAA